MYNQNFIQKITIIVLPIDCCYYRKDINAKEYNL